MTFCVSSRFWDRMRLYPRSSCTESVFFRSTLLCLADRLDESSSLEVLPCCQQMRICLEGRAWSGAGIEPGLAFGLRRYILLRTRLQFLLRMVPGRWLGASSWVFTTVPTGNRPQGDSQSPDSLRLVSSENDHADTPTMPGDPRGPNTPTIATLRFLARRFALVASLAASVTVLLWYLGEGGPSCPRLSSLDRRLNAAGSLCANARCPVVETEPTRA